MLIETAGASAVGAVAPKTLEFLTYATDKVCTSGGSAGADVACVACWGAFCTSLDVHPTPADSKKKKNLSQGRRNDVDQGSSGIKPV